jgi:hypothetical protein
MTLVGVVILARWIPLQLWLEMEAVFLRMWKMWFGNGIAVSGAQ